MSAMWLLDIHGASNREHEMTYSLSGPHALCVIIKSAHFSTLQSLLCHTQGF